MKKKNFKRLLGFTLAEVLITLSILGVVAAITVPSLIKRQHRNEVETKLRKFISTVQNAVDISVAENGPITTWTGSDMHDAYNNMLDAYNKYLIPYFNITENHSSEANNGMHRWVIKKQKPNGAVVGDWFPFSTYCLKDGICFGVHAFGFDDTIHRFTENANGEILWMGVDINGPKGPNVAGKDFFVFSINSIKKGMTSYKVEGFEAGHQTKAYQKTKCYDTDSDYHCGGVFIDNGLKFPSDYPWL